MKKGNTDDYVINRRLNWEKYDWRKFEKICFEYIKTVYSAKFYKTQLTRPNKDSGRDIIIRGKYDDYEAWGECKNHKRNIDLSIIGKNVVLALSHQINKAIFFSVTKITLNTKIEILTVAQEYGFEALFLDGNVLDETILNCKKVAYKYFRSEYETFMVKNTNSIWIDTFLSEYPFAEDAKNNVRTQYHLQNGFNIYLHVFVKNMRDDYISNLHICLKKINNSDLIFWRKEYDLSNVLAPFSDAMCSFQGMVFSPKKNINLPEIEVYTTLGNGMEILETREVGEVDASDIWKAPYINTSSAAFLETVTQLLKNVIPANYAKVLYIYGNSGTGKSRLINEIEVKAYENSYKVFHVYFREKNNMIAIQDFLMSLLGLPATKHKINLDFEEFEKTFNSKVDENTLHFLYKFLYGNEKTISYNLLTKSIINLLVNVAKTSSILICLDNIQELDRDYQMVFWNVLDHCRNISIPICFSLTHNIERKIHVKHILIEYLTTIGDNNENYVYPYECDVLSLSDATILMQQLLHLTPESDKYIEKILRENGTLPIDILLLAKNLSQQNSVFYRIGNYKYIADPHTLIENIKKLSISTEYLINNRLDNIRLNTDKLDELQALFALLCFFEGNLPMEIFDACGLDQGVLSSANKNLITKIEHKENIITFYHEKFYVFFKNKENVLSSTLLECVYNYYICYKNERIVSIYIYIKTLVALKRKDEAISQGLDALKYYSEERQNGYVSSLCDLLLGIIDPIVDPVNYFRILFRQADVWLENINISEAEKLFEQAYQIMKQNYPLFKSKDITHFFHRYINQKIHTLQYDKAINILKVFENLQNISPDASLIINDRYCVALYSLGQEKAALEKIEIVIEQARADLNNTWLSIGYSDKAFTYFFNSKDIDNVVFNFKQAIECFELCDEKDCLSRKIEISMQTALIYVLENNITDALNDIQCSIHTAEKTTYGYLLIPTYNLYAYILILTGKNEDALFALKKGLYYSNICSNEKALISIYNNLGNIYIEKQLYTQAFEYYKASYQVLKKICTPANSFRYRGLLCNLTRISAYFNDKDTLEDLHTNYNFINAENYMAANRKNEPRHEKHGILSYNGWDYLYY